MRKFHRLRDSRTDREILPLVETALRSTDRPVAMHPVGWCLAMGTPPKKLRPSPEVYEPAPKKTWGKRFKDGLLGFFGWLLDPFDWAGNWVPNFSLTREQRRQDKHLKGGWNSLAGALASSNFVGGHHVLALGDKALVLVYVGAHEAVQGWTLPLDQITGIELTTRGPPGRCGVRLGT